MKACVSLLLPKYKKRSKIKFPLSSELTFALPSFFLSFFLLFFFFAFYKQTDFSTQRDMKMSRLLLFTFCVFLSLKNIKLLNFKSFSWEYTFLAYTLLVLNVNVKRKSGWQSPWQLFCTGHSFLQQGWAATGGVERLVFELADKFLQKSRMPFDVNFSMLCLEIVPYDSLSLSLSFSD